MRILEKHITDTSADSIDGDEYYMMTFVNKEVSITYDGSKLPCGVKGALYCSCSVEWCGSDSSDILRCIGLKPWQPFPHFRK